MKKIETSKKVLGGSLVACLVFAIAAFVGWFMGRGDALGILGLIFALAAAIVKFYMNKAERENLIKIQRANGYTDEQLDHLVGLAERVTKKESEEE